MNEEKKMILDMLKEGKITVEQASDLLEAVGKDKTNSKEESFIDKLSSSFEKIMKKTSEKLSNIDIDFDLQDLNIPTNLYHFSSTPKEEQTKIDDEINEIEVDITNGLVKVERAQESGILIEQKVFFKNKEDLDKDYISVEVVEDKLFISINDVFKNLNAKAEVKLYLGKNIYDKIDINLVNGDVEICDVDFKENSLNTTNGKVNIINSAGDIDVDTTNSKIDLKNTNGNLKVDNVNGAVYLTNISGEDIDINGVNGSIRVDGMKVDKINLSTNAGSIRLSKIKEAKRIDLNTQFGSVTIDTDGLNKDIKALVKASSFNISDKFKNKIQKDGGYELSTNTEKSDLDIDVKTRFGSVSIQ